MSEQNYQDPYAQNNDPYAQQSAAPMAGQANTQYQEPYASQTNQYGQTSQYGQTGQYGQTNQYGQAGQYNQPNQYGQVAPAGSNYPAGVGGGEHPQAQTVFILGIVGIFVSVCSWIAWYLGGKAKKEIAAGAPYRFEGNLKTGYMLGKVFGIIQIVGIILYILMIALGLGTSMANR